jgi:hydroxypyruvate isomerase
MVKFSVCLDTLLTEYPFIERAKRAKDLGFLAVEFWFHDKDEDINEFGDLCKKEGIEVACFVVNSSNGDIGGALVNPEDRGRYISRLKELIPLAHNLNCKTLITCAGNTIESKTYEQQRNSILDSLWEASKIVEKEGITLVLEPLNTLVDHKGYFLDSAIKGAEIVRKINHPNIKLLYDIYHMQIMEGNIISFIERNLDIIGHFHCASVPGRNELWLAELNYKNILEKIYSLGYKGYIGLEYFPTLSSEESLKRLKEFFGG